MPVNHIQSLANNITNNGYNIAHAIPVTRMPNGKLVIGGGHH